MELVICNLEMPITLPTSKDDKQKETTVHKLEPQVKFIPT